jgi:polar amino acid transport system substrate-binding protein
LFYEKFTIRSSIVYLLFAVLREVFVKLYSLFSLLVLLFTLSCGNNGEGSSGKKKSGTPPPLQAGHSEISVVASGLIPPYYHKDQSGELTGMSAEIVRETLAHAGIRAQIEQYPVARAFLKAEKEPNVLIFALFRNPEREARFKWVCPITPPIKSVLFRLSRRKDISMEKLEDAGKFKIGVVRGNDLHTMLLARGFSDNTGIEPVMTNDINIKKLFAGRIDLCAGRELPFYFEMKHLGLERRDVEEVFVLRDDIAWMAFSLTTPDGVVEQVRAAFEQISDEGTVARIYAKYRRAGSM